MNSGFTMGCLMVTAAVRSYAGTADGGCVTVYLKGAGRVPLPTLNRAQHTAAEIFGDIGVSIHWTASATRRAAETCVPIGLQFGPDAPQAFHSGALAYALPYRDGGIQIHVFVNRILQPALERQSGLLLGHVMAHEIGHVLEAIERHSAEGVMKARWTDGDLGRMSARPLRFDISDVDLIHNGLSKRLGMAVEGTR